MVDEPNLADYMAKWMEKPIRAAEQELAARQEHAEDTVKWLRARIDQIEAENNGSPRR